MNSKTAALCTFILIAVGALGLAQSPNDHYLREIKNYKTMIRVNREPVDMVDSTKFMCAPPFSVYGPHYDPGVVYYINTTTQKGLDKLSEKIVFPVGSIIVKEKQERKTEDSVQIITVMRKVLPQSSEDSWEYKMYDVKTWTEIDSKNVTKPATQSCIGCHRRYQNNDYVSDKGIALLRGK